MKGNLLCLQSANNIPSGKEKKELKIVNNIVRVNPPQYLLITGDIPIPP